MIRVDRYPLKRPFRRQPQGMGYVIHAFGMSWLYVRHGGRT